MIAQPTHANAEATRSLYQLDSTPKKLSIDSSWDEILSELYTIRAELTAIKNMEAPDNAKTRISNN